MTWILFVGLLVLALYVIGIRRRLDARDPQRTFFLNINARAAVLAHPRFAAAAGTRIGGMEIWRKERKNANEQAVVRRVDERSRLHLHYLPGEDSYFVSGPGRVNISSHAHTSGVLYCENVLSSEGGELYLNVEQRTDGRGYYLDVQLQYDGPDVEMNSEVTTLCSIPVFDPTARFEAYGFERGDGLGSGYKQNGVVVY